MVIFVTGLHIALCFFLILVVLLQPGKSADFGAAMGGTSQGQNSTSGPTTVLGRVTAIVAALFMVTSMALAYFSNQTGDLDINTDQLQELLDEEKTETESTGGEEAGPDPEADPAPEAETAAPAGDAAPEADADPEDSAAAPEGDSTPEGDKASEGDADPEGDAAPEDDGASE